MATKKTAPETEEVKAEAEAPVEPEKNAEAVEEDPWKKMVTIFVPRARKSEDPNAYVCVNDRRFSIPRNGKMQEMPQPIAELLQASIEAEAVAEEFAENLTNRDPEKAK